MKREAEVLEPASAVCARRARATCAAEALRAALGDHARFKGRPFSEIIAEISDGGGGGGGGAAEPYTHHRRWGRQCPAAAPQLRLCILVLLALDINCQLKPRFIYII